MKYIDRTVVSKYEPKTTDVMWVFPTENGETELRTFVNGKWKAVGDDSDAYRKPQDGIPESDLSLAVKNTLDSADISAEIINNKDHVPTQFSGLGRVNLEKNIQTIDNVEKNILTQDMFYKGMPGQRVPNINTIFVIQYDYDLNDPNGTNPITIPEGCVLKFDGGSIKNGKIVGNNTKLDNACSGCLTDINIDGTFDGNGDVFHINWFFPDTTNIPVISSVLQVGVNNWDNVCIDNGNYTITDTIILRSGVTIFGESKENAILHASLDRLKDGKMKYTMFSIAEVTKAWNSEPGTRHANETNTNDDIIADNITIRDLTFKPNRAFSNFQDKESGLLGAYCICIYYVDTNNSVITNCDFIDYQEAGQGQQEDGKYHNNGSNMIQFYNVKNSKVSHCYSEKCTLFMGANGDNNELSFNKGVYSVGTWIENSRYFEHAYYHDNEIKDVYWDVSMMSSNSKYCVVERNKIISTMGVSHPSAFTFGHNGTLYNASYGVFRDNYINLDIAKFGVLIQNASNLTIENNDITLMKRFTPEEFAEFDTWDKRKSEEAACIIIDSYDSDSSINIIGNKLVHEQYHGIYIRPKSTNISYIIQGNSIDVYTTGIVYNESASYSGYINCQNNTINSDYCAFHNVIYKALFNTIISKNKITGFILNVGTIEDNIFELATVNKRGNSDTTIIVLTGLDKVSYKRNIFNFLPDWVTYVFSIEKRFSDYANELDKYSMYECISDNVITDSNDANKLCRVYLWGSGGTTIILKPEVYYGKGDISNLTLSTYDKGLQFYDIVNDKPVWWNGTAWVDATGTAVS